MAFSLSLFIFGFPFWLWFVSLARQFKRGRSKLPEVIRKAVALGGVSGFFRF
jgi:hypothetical protein